MSEKTKKESLLKYAIAFTAITLSLIVLSVLTYVHIDRILLETSMETMTDMADHDKSAAERDKRRVGVPGEDQRRF